MANCWDFMRSQLDRKVDSLKTFVGLSKATNIPPGALVNYVPGRWASKVVLIVFAVITVIIDIIVVFADIIIDIFDIRSEVNAIKMVKNCFLLVLLAKGYD